MRLHPRTKNGSRRVEALLPPELGAQFDATLARRGSHVYKRVAWGVREAISEWVNRPDEPVPVDDYAMPPQLDLFDQLSRTQLPHDQADEEEQLEAPSS